ncbi:MAG: ATP-binding cassette domain-containing protein [Wenzhouxiangella sp.]|nr:ATP-binding cassette domain-containing protein [Wenzhouxiangella sp.]MCH8476575.1 ATP-binding cassette domain-containing protein [Wenzhouxiangella sp.]TVR93231.1 MAG: ATP-binding cassette domain-containing protein [Wenzhouxiangellaceae bacterium]
MIEAKALRKTFNKGKVVAVDEVSFSARDGQITGLLGPNGAGKTTTLRMLYTLLKPDSGGIKVDGIDPAAEPLKIKRALGVVPDSRGLYDRLTARENIRYYGRLHGLDKATIERRIDEFVRVLDMGEFIDRKTDGFSQGQRVKVAIARALIHDPRTVLLDEPSNGLDVMTTRALREFLRQLKSQGRCVVLSTHIMQEVAALCDRIVIIAHGRVAAEGTADELLARSGEKTLEDAFVKLIGSDEGLLA